MEFTIAGKLYVVLALFAVLQLGSCEDSFTKSLQLPLNASLLQERNQTEQQLYSQLDVMCQVLEDIGSLQDAMNNTMDAADPTSVLAVEAVGRQLQSDIYNWTAATLEGLLLEESSFSGDMAALCMQVKVYLIAASL